MIASIKALPKPSTDDVMRTTGPIGFWKFYEKFDKKPNLLPPKYLLPYTGGHKLSKIIDDTNNIYAYTIWTEGTNWGNNQTQNQNQSLTQNPASFWGTMAVILVVIFLLIIIFMVYQNQRRTQQ
jgi:hypothetical protein